MAKLVLTILLAGGALGVSAAGSWMLLKSRSGDVVDAEPKAGLDALVEPEKERLDSPTPGRSLDAEEAFRYSALVRAEQDKLKAREEALEKDQERVRLIYDDIRTQQREIGDVQSQIRETLQEGEQLLTEIQLRRDELKSQQNEAATELKDLQNKRTSYKQDELTNLKQIAQWLEKMSPDKAAEFLRAMSNDGKMTTAVQLLRLIEERYAAKILEAANDATLVVQWTDLLKTFEQPEKPKRR